MKNKNLFLLILGLLAICESNLVAQISTRVTVVNTSTNRASIYTKPNSSITGVVSDMGVTISIPDQGANNPVVTVDSNYVASLNWQAPTGANANPIIYNGRAYYSFIGTNNTSATTNWIIGNNKAITLLFSNSNGFSDLQLNDETATYGPSGLIFFFVNLETGDITDYNQKFYGVDPFPSNNLSSPSFVGLQSISILEIFF